MKKFHKVNPATLHLLIAAAILGVGTPSTYAEDAKTPGGDTVIERIHEIERDGLHRPRAEQQLYFVVEGDTIQRIARQFSEDKSFASELLALNQLTEADLHIGRPLVIPGAERARALQAMDGAKKEMKLAVAANAAKFALQTFKQAVDVYDDGSNARKAGSYHNAVLLGNLARDRFRQSRAIADRDAMQPQAAQLKVLNGKVFASVNNGLSYASAEAASELLPGHIIRTAPDSHALITFQDQSTLLLKPASILSLPQYEKDQRTGRSHRIARLQAGALEANVKPLTVEHSTFTLMNSGTQLALNDTQTAAYITDRGHMIQSTFRGQAQVSFQGQGIEQPTGYGSITTRKDGLKGPFPLSESVDLLKPARSGTKSAEQSYPFTWRESARHGDVSYRLEVARDPLFSDLAVYVITDEATHTSEPLSAGKYYVRVGTVDPDGLPGFDSEVITLQIETNLELTLGYGLHELTLDEVTYVAPNAEIIAVPTKPDTSIDYIMYQIDDGPFFASENGVTLADTGTYTVHARPHGKDKTSGAVVSKTVTTDNTPPELRVHVGELSDVPGYGTIRSVAFIADDNTQLERLEYSLNGESYKAYKAPLKLPVSKNFRIEARAIDYFENISETVMSLEEIKPSKQSSRINTKDKAKNRGLFERLFGKNTDK